MEQSLGLGKYTVAGHEKRDTLRCPFRFGELAQDQQNDGQDQESSANPLGAAGDLGIDALGLVLGQEGIGNAADGAGQTGALAGLEQNGQDDGQAANQLQNGNKQFHKVNPPKFTHAQSMIGHFTDNNVTIDFDAFQGLFQKRK